MAQREQGELDGDPARERAYPPMPEPTAGKKVEWARGRRHSLAYWGEGFFVTGP